jgi:hypothetical protein
MSLAVAGGRAITNEAECLNQLMGRLRRPFGLSDKVIWSYERCVPA